MKKKISVSQVCFGMYIHELDRPWTETPFMFQGFVISNDKQLETLKEYCKNVVIETDKGADVAAGSGGGDRSRSVLDLVKNKVVYEEKTQVSLELPAARQAHGKATAVLKDMFGSIQAGNAVDADRVRDVVTNMTDSIVRNPDAMLLLAKMKAKAEHILDRAMGASVYMIMFGRFLQLPREQLDLLGTLGLLQDVGKLRLPAELLNKKERLSDAELKICASHVGHSVAILKQTAGIPAEFPALVALHHERYNGSGYPAGLKGAAIGLFGSIAGIVDFFDAVTSARPYGETMSPSNALSMLYKLRDIEFDGALVEQFIQCIGIFPVGAIVELNSGETGIVIAQNLARRLQPRVMVVLDAQGRLLKPQKILDLAKEPKVDPETPYRIKRTLEKGSIPIDFSEFFM